MDTVVGCVALLVLLPVLVLLAEVISAITAGSDPASIQGERRRLAVLIPAHNEATVIVATLRSILPQLLPGDRAVVVADNCTDGTEAIARREQAEVLVRTNTVQRGKGFALDYGIRHLEHDRPDVVIVVDADCDVEDGGIEKLARACDHFHRPIQALYLMRHPSNARPRMKIAEFAWIVKNRVRPAGLRHLGLPCQLTGSGMAFPWTQISGARLATGHIVEDLKLGIDLAREGAPPVYLPDCVITSEFPQSEEGASEQRKRWEHGHLDIISRVAPGLIWDGVTRANLDLLALGLDVIVPPLALLTLLAAVVWFGALLLLLLPGSSPVPLIIATLVASLLFLAVCLSWVKFGRRVLSGADLCYSAFYALIKIPMYLRFLISRQTAWVRSKRNHES